jgi:hypothetical protein
LKIQPILQSRRLWGLTGTAVLLYLLIFKVLGGLDVGWLMPRTDRIADALIELWPRMPFFTQKVTGPKGTEIYYTVPTRQLTPQELARMGLTNSVAHPVRPK